MHRCEKALQRRWRTRGGRTITLLSLIVIGLTGCMPDAPTAVTDIDQLEETLARKTGTMQLNNVLPAMGPVDEDTIVLLRGAGFTDGMTVHFGDQEATTVQVIDETRATAQVPQNGAGAVDVRVANDHGDAVAPDGFTWFLLGPEDGTDSDGDGLTDHQELKGWTIKVDVLGWGLDSGHVENVSISTPIYADAPNDDILVVYTARSDINNPDTDGDGLPDADEFFVRSDPILQDTDSDGLWDGEEWFRWLTSPVSVDSDGDARSPDVSSARATLPPNASLFDGAELYTSAQLVLEPSARGEIKLNATSPTLDDTDGDNVRDTDEIDTPVRVPWLADMPQLLFEIVDNVDVRLDVEYAEEEGTSTAFETSFETGQSRTEGASQSNTVSASVTAGVSYNPADGFGMSTEVTAGREQSWETTQESTVRAAQTLAEAEERSRTNTETAASGSITAGIRITNMGNITVQVIDHAHTLRQWIPNANPAASNLGAYATLAALAPDLGSGLTLSPGADSGVLLAQATDLNADRVKELLRRPEALQLQPAAYELVNDQGINFAFIEEVTQARTARVSIDFGDGRFEEYRVATNVDRNADSTLAGISLARALDLTVGVDEWESANLIAPCGPQSSDVIQNGSFESPTVNEDISNADPTNWTERDLGPGGANLEVGVFGFADVPAPSGSQWAYMRLDGQSLSEGGIAFYQQIGVAQAFNATYDYQFYQLANNEGADWDASFSVELWQGLPGAVDSVVLDSDAYTADTLEGTVQRSGTLAANLSSVTPGAPLYIEINAQRVLGVVGEPELYLLIDDFQLQPDFVPGAEVLDVVSRIRDASADVDQRRLWSIFLAGEDLAGTDFSTVTLKAGDAVLLAFQKDVDGDGLYASQEQQYGSSDTAVDTDGDGLTDPEEAVRIYSPDGCTQDFGGWDVTVTARDGSTTVTRVYSDPARADADQDGLTDDIEKSEGTDPNSADTDNDGLTDDIDPEPKTQARIVFVDDTADGADDGTSWSDAYTSLNTAIEAAANPATNAAEVWVAVGSYEQITGSLPNNVSIYGGFIGNETKLSQRTANALANQTLVQSGSAVPIFGQTVANVTCRIDGFTFEGSTNRVLDMNADGCDITFANCFFASNTAVINPNDVLYGAAGGAVQALGNSDLTFDDCIFADNHITTAQATPTEGRGGAMFVDVDNLTLTRCSFLNNQVINTVGLNLQGYFATRGGAINIDGDTVATIDDCEFRTNRVLNNTIFNGSTLFGLEETPLQGGAVYLSGACRVRFDDCRFRDNAADDAGDSELSSGSLDPAFSETRAGGAVMVGAGTTANFLNSVFRGNRASMYGGAMFVEEAGTARVVNATFVENAVRPTGPTNFADGWTNGSTWFSAIAVGAAIGSSGQTSISNTAFWNNTGVATVLWGLPNDNGTNHYLTWGVEVQVATRPNITLDNPGGLAYLPNIGEVTLEYSAFNSLNEVTFVPNANNHDPIVAPVRIFTGNIATADPGFVDLVRGDLRLAADSPLIDAGQTVVDTSLLEAGFQLLPLFDLDGLDRVVDGLGDGDDWVDIGAFEFQGTN